MVTKWKLKKCPRCNGDLYIEKDIHEEPSERCLQCGYEKPLNATQDLKLFQSNSAR